MSDRWMRVGVILLVSGGAMVVIGDLVNGHYGWAAVLVGTFIGGCLVGRYG